ncbi:MAG: hypothetical protein LBL94_06915 [Prevotellaceae bacterium]|jgi:hypothetical protein|nr:hypothetical protein [Prevotellaceae bacterium]
MNALTGNAQNHAMRSIAYNRKDTSAAKIQQIYDTQYDIFFYINKTWTPPTFPWAPPTSKQKQAIVQLLPPFDLVRYLPNAYFCSVFRSLNMKAKFSMRKKNHRAKSAFRRVLGLLGRICLPQSAALRYFYRA